MRLMRLTVTSLLEQVAGMYVRCAHMTAKVRSRIESLQITGTRLQDKPEKADLQH